MLNGLQTLFDQLGIVQWSKAGGATEYIEFFPYRKRNVHGDDALVWLMDISYLGFEHIVDLGLFTVDSCSALQRSGFRGLLL